MTDTQLTEEQKELARAALDGMLFARLIGMRMVAIDRDTATVELEVRPDLLQPGGLLHGGVTATLIDTAMAFAVRTRVAPGQPTATIDLTVHYLRPVTSGRIECTARVVRAGKRIFNVSAELFDPDGRLAATGVSVYTLI